MKKYTNYSLGNHYSLTGKTLWILVLWGLIITVGFIWFVNQQLAKVFDKQKFNYAQQIARSFDIVIRTLPPDHPLQPLVQNLSQESEIKLIAVVGNSPPQIIAATEMQWVNKPITHISDAYLLLELEEALETKLPYHVYRKDIQQYCFSFPIRLNRADLPDAVLLVRLDALPSRQIIHDLSLEMGMWILGLISVLIGFTYILLYYFVLRPLHSLHDMVNSRLNYQAEYDAPKFADDELGEFADKLNQLLRQMARDFQQIRKIASIAETHHAVIITDANGFIEWVNAGFTQLTEYHLDEVKGKKPGAFLQGPETDHRAVNQIREAVQQQQPFDVEIINYSKTYRQYWVAIHAQPVFDAEAQLLYYFAIEIDVTARKRTENTLQKNAIQIHHLIEKPADSLIIMDKQGSMHYVDTISDMILGQQAKGLINLIFSLPPQDEEATEYFATHPTLVAEVRTVETDWEGETFYFASLRNITDKHNEIIKYEQDARYRAAIEATDTGLVIVDINGVVLEANLEYARLTGRNNLEDIIGNNVLDWTTIYDKERNSLAIKTCLDKGFLKNFDVDYLTPDGKVIPIEVNAKAINVKGEIRILALCWEIMESHPRRPFYQTSEFLYSIINALPMFIFVKALPSNHFVLWNPVGEALFQLTAIAVLGKADYEVFAERQQVDFFWQHDAEIVTYRKPFMFSEPLALETATGSRCFHVTKLPLSDKQGNPQFILGMLHEIDVEK